MIKIKDIQEFNHSYIIINILLYWSNAILCIFINDHHWKNENKLDEKINWRIKSKTWQLRNLISSRHGLKLQNDECFWRLILLIFQERIDMMKLASRDLIVFNMGRTAVTAIIRFTFPYTIWMILNVIIYHNILYYLKYNKCKHDMFSYYLT